MSGNVCFSSEVISEYLIKKYGHERQEHLAVLYPSGEVMPSKNDLTFTKQIKTACDTVGVDVLDHIIVGRDAYYSFREEGDLV